MTIETVMHRSLADLEKAALRDIAMIAHPAKDWMPSRTAPDGKTLHDVVIVGAGQGGLAIAFQLQRERVRNILVIEKAPYGREGVWTTFARMPHLRSPKDFTGPDLGVPSLTYQAWHEAVHGAQSWQTLHRIPKGHWNDYLLWLRALLAVPVRNETELVRIEPAEHCLALSLRTQQGLEVIHTRKLVLATGQDGTGRWFMPDFIEALPKRFRARAADEIDFAALAGKTVAVLGAGASAADNAATALEHGAVAVHMFVRREKLQRVQPFLWLTFAGFLRHIGDMPDAWRWRFMSRILGLRESFPQDTYERVRRHANFEIHTGAGWQSARVKGDGATQQIEITTAKGPFVADFIICGAGIEIDPTARPELGGFADAIATWADRYTPPAGEANARLARFPYLGPNGEFLEKVPGAAPYLNRIHDFTIGATMSFGPSGCSINAMNIAVPKLVAGLTRTLFAEDLELHWASLEAYDDKIFEPAAIDRRHV